VPERVRDAFDVLQQGVMVLDQRHRVMMGNDALMRLCPPGTEPTLGGPVSQFDWLLNAIDAAGARRPWETALAEGGVTPEQVLSLHARGDAAVRHVTLAATPIFDNEGSVRGTLVTVTDVTPLHQLNAELEQSREALRQQNEHLHNLATRDPLTNCLNRRAFFERGEAVFARDRTNSILACIMVDIDHFKQVNDRHGHGVGDVVIRAVGRVLDRVSRHTDLVCRYGGEEFCVLAPQDDVGNALLLANRVRAEIESSAGSSVDEVPGMQVTVSIGLALWQPGCARLLDLIGRADDALYHSKRGGRNRVTIWHAELNFKAAASATA
jgi:diguanylate cyclase (GGDEF)-like protein